MPRKKIKTEVDDEQVFNGIEPGEPPHDGVEGDDDTDDYYADMMGDSLDTPRYESILATDGDIVPSNEALSLDEDYDFTHNPGSYDPMAPELSESLEYERESGKEWPLEKERDLCMLWEEETQLYDHSDPHYKKSYYRQRAVGRMAATLGMTEERVKKRLETLRTAFQKMVNLPREHKAEALTPRQRNILRLVGFLRPHVKIRANAIDLKNLVPPIPPKPAQSASCVTSDDKGENSHEFQDMPINIAPQDINSTSKHGSRLSSGDNSDTNGDIQLEPNGFTPSKLIEENPMFSMTKNFDIPGPAKGFQRSKKRSFCEEDSENSKRSDYKKGPKSKSKKSGLKESDLEDYLSVAEERRDLVKGLAESFTKFATSLENPASGTKMTNDIDELWAQALALKLKKFDETQREKLKIQIDMLVFDASNNQMPKS